MQNNIILVLTAFLIITLTSCNSNKEKISILEDENLELQMIDAYKEAYMELEKVMQYTQLKNLMRQNYYSHNQNGRQKQYCCRLILYSQNYYDEAISELDRFFKKYPKHPNTAYAHFLFAMCYYENIIDEKKDLEPLLISKKDLSLL